MMAPEIKRAGDSIGIVDRLAICGKFRVQVDSGGVDDLLLALDRAGAGDDHEVPADGELADAVTDLGNHPGQLHPERRAGKPGLDGLVRQQAHRRDDLVVGLGDGRERAQVEDADVPGQDLDPHEAAVGLAQLLVAAEPGAQRVDLVGLDLAHRAQAHAGGLDDGKMPENKPVVQWDTIQALPLRKQISALLQYSIEYLVARSLVPSSNSYTNRELVSCLEKSDSRKAGLLREQIDLTEPVLYGDERVSEEQVIACRDKSRRLRDA